MTVLLPLVLALVPFDDPTPAVKEPQLRDQILPLVVREIAIDSVPEVAKFEFPIEIALDVSDAPEMKEWGEKTVRVCERGVQAADANPHDAEERLQGRGGGGRGADHGVGEVLQGAPERHRGDGPRDGPLRAELRGRRAPGGLVEGIADYIRFWKYEPGKAGKLTPERARYDGSYRVTAAFLAFVTEQYDPKLVNKLNAALRGGTYDVAMWKELTGKAVEELNQEWRQSLAK